jgi:hypothetical protein
MSHFVSWSVTKIYYLNASLVLFVPWCLLVFWYMENYKVRVKCSICGRSYKEWYCCDSFRALIVSGALKNTCSRCYPPLIVNPSSAGAEIPHALKK